MNNFKFECEYLLEKLEDIYEQSSSVIEIAENLLYNDEIKNKQIAENNLFYLDAIRVFIKDSIFLLDNINYNFEYNHNDNNNILYFIPYEKEEDIFVDINNDISSIFDLQDK